MKTCARAWPRPVVAATLDKTRALFKKRLPFSSEKSGKITDGASIGAEEAAADFVLLCSAVNLLRVAGGGRLKDPTLRQ